MPAASFGVLFRELLSGTGDLNCQVLIRDVERKCREANQHHFSANTIWGWHVTTRCLRHTHTQMAHTLTSFIWHS